MDLVPPPTPPPPLVHNTDRFLAAHSCPEFSLASATIIIIVVVVVVGAAPK